MTLFDLIVVNLAKKAMSDAGRKLDQDPYGIGSALAERKAARPARRAAAERGRKRGAA